MNIEWLWPEEAFGIETSIDIRCRRLLFLVSLYLFSSANARWLIVSEQMPFCFYCLGLFFPSVHFDFIRNYISQRNENILQLFVNNLAATEVYFNEVPRCLEIDRVIGHRSWVDS